MDYSLAAVLADTLTKRDGEANNSESTKVQEEMHAWMDALLHPKIAVTDDGKVTLSVIVLQEILDAVVRVEQKMRPLSKKISALHGNRMDMETFALHDKAKQTTSAVRRLIDTVHQNLPIVRPPEPTVLSSARAEVVFCPPFDAGAMRPCTEPMRPCGGFLLPYADDGYHPLSCEALALASLAPEATATAETATAATGTLPPADEEDLYA